MSNRKSTKRAQLELDHPVNKKMTVETVTVTPALAREMLEYNQHNRNVRDTTVSRYARDMGDGNWRMSAEPVKFDWNGRLIDGQHRLLAIIKSDAPVTLMIVKNLDPDSQTVLDAGAKRTAADALRFKGTTRHAATLAGMARVAIMWDQRMLTTAASSPSVNVSNSEVLDWVESNKDATEAAAIGSSFASKVGVSPSVLAFAALKFIALSPEEALEFISSTAELRTNGARDPRVVMIRKIQRLKEDRVRMTTAIQLSLLFRAWNTWRAGKGIGNFHLNAAGGNAVAIPEPK